MTIFARIRRHISATSVLAVLALVFAMSGGAYAARKFLITSTKQISPSVLKSLKGANGKSGTAGPAGPTGPAGPAGTAGAGTPGAGGSQGPAGATGKEGAPGKEGKEGKEGQTGFTSTLPKGATETGTLAARFEEGTTEGNSISAISFPIPLAVSLGQTAVHYVTTEEQQKGTGPAACPGLVEEPAATAGSLCIYQGATEPAGAALTIPIISPPSNVGLAPGAGTAGAMAHVHFEGVAGEAVEFQASWAVTAP
jgi:hypothetical protein